MRIGIVGCGHIGMVHGAALEQLVNAGLVDARVTATFDADPTRAAALAVPHGATPAATLDALLDSVDVVWICTWTAAHADAVEAAADRGLPIFCEKPLAPDLASSERVAAALRRVPHQVGLVLAHAPVFRTAAELVRSGRYGRVLTTILRDDQYFPIQGMYGSSWRGDVAKAGGGTFIEHSIHDVAVLGSILGEPADVAARTSSQFGHAGIEDQALVTLGYADGTTATIASVWHQILSRGSSRRLEIFCEKAMLWTEDDYLGPLHVETEEGVELFEAEAPPWIDRFAGLAEFAKPIAQYAEPSKAFLDALAADGPAARGWPDVEAALAAHRVVDAAYRSATGGGTPIPLRSRERRAE
jgi:predicted dehydrogenase